MTNVRRVDKELYLVLFKLDGHTGKKVEWGKRVRGRKRGGMTKRGRGRDWGGEKKKERERERDWKRYYQFGNLLYKYQWK